VFWWVINLSDRYFVTSLWGDVQNGLYTAASIIPGIITTISAIFIQAWQISAFSEYSRREAERFYTTVFRSYYAFVFLAASGIILLVRPITKILVDEAYYDSWQYVPFLVLGISFSCFVTFLGIIYNLVKKNSMVTVTTAIGAVLNLILNALMIPKMGPIGAAVATCISYFAVFVIRAIATRKHVRIHMQPLRIGASLLLLLAQIAVSLTEPKGGIIWQILLFIGLVVCNLGYILYIGEHFWKMISSRRNRAGTDSA
jgi:O-antigen/teichoic acid export membrane protein